MVKLRAAILVAIMAFAPASLLADDLTFDDVLSGQYLTLSEQGQIITSQNSDQLSSERYYQGGNTLGNAQFRVRPVTENCMVQINGECQTSIGNWTAWESIRTLKAIDDRWQVDFRMQAGGPGSSRTEILWFRQNGSWVEVPITVNAFQDTRPNAVDVDLGRKLADTGNQKFTETFSITGSGNTFLYPAPTGNAQFRVSGTERQCAACSFMSGGTCFSCFRYEDVTVVKQNWTGSGSVAVQSGDTVDLRMNGPASPGDPDTLARMILPDNGRAQMSVAYLADPFDGGFRSLVGDFEPHIFFHAENPEAETIRVLRNSTVEASLDITGLLEGGNIDPVMMTVPAGIQVVRNMIPMTTPASPTDTSIEVMNGDRITLQVTGGGTTLFNSDNSVGAGSGSCPAPMAEDGAVACQTFPVEFTSGTLSETRTWVVGRAPTAVSSGEADGTSVSLADFDPATGVMRGFIVESNEIEITTPSVTPADVTLRVSIEDDAGNDILTSQTSLVINGDDRDVQSEAISISAGNPVRVSLRTTVKPDLFDTSSGNATLVLSVAGEEARWNVSWLSGSPDLQAVAAALDAETPGMGQRLQQIITASVVHYDLDPLDNMFLDNIRITPLGRIVDYLESNSDMTIMTPRAMMALSGATQDSRRPYGERAAEAPVTFEGIFFDDILNADISSLTETSSGALLTPNVAGINPVTSSPYTDGEIVPILILQRQGNPQFRTADDCSLIGGEPWQNFTLTSTMAVGDCIQLRLRSSDFYNTIRQVRFTAGQANAVWRVKTRTVPVRIDDFTPVMDAEWDTVIESLEANPIESADGSPIQPVLATPDGDGEPEICVVSSAGEACSGGWTDGSVLVDAGDFIRIRATSANVGAQTTTASVVLGDVSDAGAPRGNFDITTTAGAPPILESLLGTGDFIDLENQPTNTIVQSNAITVRQDASDPAAFWYVDIDPGSQADTQIKVNSEAPQTGLVQIFPDDRIRLLHRTSPSQNATETSQIRFFSTSDNTQEPILTRDWATTTGVGIQRCNVFAGLNGSDRTLTLGKDAGDPYQGPSHFYPHPGIIPGDEVAIDLKRIDELEAWEDGYTPHPDEGSWPTQSYVIGTGIFAGNGGWNDRGYFEDLTCNQSNGLGFTPTAGNPGEAFHVEITDYRERYDSYCCTGPEFAYHAYPFGRAVNDPITTPLTYDRAGGSNDSIAGTIPYSPVAEYGGRAANSMSGVGGGGVSGSYDTSIHVNAWQIGVPDFGGVAGDDYTPAGSFGLNDPENAYLIVNGVDQGIEAMVRPGDTVELGLRTSEGMYAYEVILTANGYAKRGVEVEVADRTPKGVIEPRGQDFGDFQAPSSGPFSVDDVFTVPPVMSDQASFYPSAIRSLRGSFDMKGPVVLVYVPLNNYAEAVMRGNVYDPAVSAPCTGNCDEGNGLRITTMNSSMSGFEAPNFTVVTPYYTHGNTTLTSPDSRFMTGPTNRRFSAMSGEEHGFRVREVNQIKGRAEFGVYLRRYEDLPAGAPDTFNRIVGTNARYSNIPGWAALTVPDGEGPTAYGMADQAWQDALLGTFAIVPSIIRNDPPYEDLTDQLTNTISYSNESFWSGFTGSLPVSTAGAPDAQMSINDGPWVTSSTIVSGDGIKLRHRTSPSTDTTTTQTVTVGSNTVSWSNTTGNSVISCAAASTGTNWQIWEDDRVSIRMAGNITPGGSNPEPITGVFVPEADPWAYRNANTGEYELCGAPASPEEIVIHSSRGIVNPELFVDGGNRGNSVMYGQGDNFEIRGTFVQDNWEIIFGRTTGTYRHQLAQDVYDPPVFVWNPKPQVDLGAFNAGSNEEVLSNPFTIQPDTITEADWYPSWITPLNSNLPYSDNGQPVNVSAFTYFGGLVGSTTSNAVTPGNSVRLRASTPFLGSGVSEIGLIINNGATSIEAGRMTINWTESEGATAPVTDFNPTSGARNAIVTSNAQTISGISGFGGCDNFSQLSRASTLTWRDEAVIVNGVPDTSVSSVRICNGDSVQLRTRVYNGYFASWRSATYTLDVGPHSLTWQVN